MYAALGRRLYEASDTQGSVAVITDLKQKLRSRIPSQQEVDALFPEVIYTDNLTRQKKLVKYILVGLDQSITGPTVTNYHQMTIEHLKPQSSIGQSGVTDHLIGQIGNLLLVPEALNAKLKDKSFKEKRRILIENNFNLPDEIKNAADWDEPQIQNRTADLAKMAYTKTWHL